jgi:predicted transcriptional regulator
MVRNFSSGDSGQNYNYKMNQKKIIKEDIKEDISKPSADVLAIIERLAENYNRIKR